MFIERGVRQPVLFSRAPLHFDLVACVVRCGCNNRLKGLVAISLLLVIIVIILVEAPVKVQVLVVKISLCHLCIYI